MTEAPAAQKTKVSFFTIFHTIIVQEDQYDPNAFQEVKHHRGSPFKNYNKSSLWSKSEVLGEGTTQNKPDITPQLTLNKSEVEGSNKKKKKKKHPKDSMIQSQSQQ